MRIATLAALCGLLGCVPTYFDEAAEPELPGAPAVDAEPEPAEPTLQDALYGTYDVDREACRNPDSATRLTLAEGRWVTPEHDAEITEIELATGQYTVSTQVVGPDGEITTTRYTLRPDPAGNDRSIWVRESDAVSPEGSDAAEKAEQTAEMEEPAGTRLVPCSGS